MWPAGEALGCRAKGMHVFYIWKTYDGSCVKLLHLLAKHHFLFLLQE